MKIILDGNDGTGKSTLAEALRQRGYEVADRGIPTKMTDDPNLRPGPDNKDELYCLLDAPVSVCQTRLKAAGKDLTEKYHTVEDLTHYRKRYLEVAVALGVPLIDSSGTRQETLDKVIYYIKNWKGLTMGTRSTRTVGATTATRAIEAALRSGTLSHEALAQMMEILSDTKSPGSDNFIIVDGIGADDDVWFPET